MLQALDPDRHPHQPGDPTGDSPGQAAATVDVYSDAWKHLRGVMVQGTARVIDGGPEFRRIRKLLYVTLPLQLPIALVALLFGIVFTAGDFAVVYILTQGGPFNSTQVLPTWAFAIGINSGSLGEGAAISLYLFPLLILVTVAMLFFARRAQVT